LEARLSGFQNEVFVDLMTDNYGGKQSGSCEQSLQASRKQHSQPLPILKPDHASSGNLIKDSDRRDKWDEHNEMQSIKTDPNAMVGSEHGE
jgi:hypothetical protein